MENFENVKFDASQYDFFGGNVMEFEIEGSEKAADDEQFQLSEKPELKKESKPKASTKKISNPKYSLSRRVIGTVKWYSYHKKYGFIIPNGGGEDVYMNFSDLKYYGSCLPPLPGTHVEYEPITNFDGRKQAINIMKVELPSQVISFNNAKNVMNYCAVAKCGALDRTQSTNYTMWKANSFVECGGGWPGFAWCCYCGKIGYFHHM
ncbi:cold shock domain-containing protein 3-like [Mercurialis annua]|uniref:cold shock domain-containing protein 3-like n=1 Tax=Mercurialis annua TaxID=3986 RepID=UPI00215F9B5F|nr:cold shock domain-containing protein 3-like [Mercurialis annua]